MVRKIKNLKNLLYSRASNILYVDEKDITAIFIAMEEHKSDGKYKSKLEEISKKEGRSARVVSAYLKNYKGNHKESFRMLEEIAEKSEPIISCFIGRAYLIGVFEDRNSYEKGVKFLKKSADNGYLEAMYYLGLIYKSSEKPEDQEKAFYYFTLAAEEGDPLSKAQVGYLYDLGLGTFQDSKKAFEWIKEAVDDGVKSARTRLASMYIEGEGTNKDIDKGKKLLEEITDKGIIEKFMLGKLYANEGNYYNALQMFKKLLNKEKRIKQYREGTIDRSGYEAGMIYLFGEEGYQKVRDSYEATTQYLVGIFYKYGNGVRSDLDESFKYLSLSAEKGHPEANYEAGLFCLDGIGTVKSYKKAFDYFEKAVEKGYKKAHYQIGIIFYEGLGKRKNYKKALEFFEEALEAGEEKAFYQMGRMYMDEKVTFKDFEKASKLLNKARKAGITEASKLLGILYKNGKVVKKNDAKAFNLFMEAIKGGDKEAEYYLGMYYKDGIGTAQNLEKAKEYFIKSGKKGEEYALIELGKLYVEELGDSCNDLKVKEDQIRELRRKIEVQEKKINNLIEENKIDFSSPDDFKIKKYEEEIAIEDSRKKLTIPEKKKILVLGGNWNSKNKKQLKVFFDKYLNLVSFIEFEETLRHEDEIENTGINGIVIFDTSCNKHCLFKKFKKYITRMIPKSNANEVINLFEEGNSN